MSNHANMRHTHPLRSPSRVVATVAALGTMLALLIATPSHGQEELSTQILRGVVPPVGFGASLFVETDGLPTGVTVGPDGRVYVTAVTTDSFISEGKVFAFEDLGGVAGPSQEVAAGLDQPLGLTFGPDGTLYVSENADNRGRVTALHDEDGDGVRETHRTVIQNLPNGRHQTNGLTFGPDGWLYVANGNATDDGIYCGPEPVSPQECPAPEVKPWSGAIIKVDPAWTDVDLLADVDLQDPDAFEDPDRIGYEEVLVAEGFRNIYGVEFSPTHPGHAYTVMNGSDNPSSSEPIYRTDVTDVTVQQDPLDPDPVARPVIDDMGFPSCLYDPHWNDFPLPETGHDHPGTFVPQDNPRQEVIDEFGRCRKTRVTIPIEFAEEGHEGTSGVAFAQGDGLPERYQGDLFYAEWGSLWNLNGGHVTGHKVIHADIDDDGLITRQREFLTTPLPIDVTFDPDGVMYVADMSGFVLRVEHLADTPGEMTVRMVQGQFVPQVVSVPRRTTVTWVNEDMSAHSVRAEQAIVQEPPLLRSGSEIDSDGDVEPSGTHSHAFGDLAGTWVYGSDATSTDELTMRGAVVVTPVNR